MATLEKIRSKSVLLVVIIAVALLAFILGDAITNGRNLFGNNTTVAKIGGDKIEYQDYQRKQQEISQQIEEAKRQNPQSYANYDSQVLSQQTIEQLVDEMLVNKAVEATGIKASPEMLRFYMIENPMETPELNAIINGLRQSGIQVTSVEQAYSVIFQPQNFGLTERQVEPFQKAWIAMEDQYGRLISQRIYGTLFTNSFKANNLDVAAMRRDYVAAANVSVAKKPYGQIDENKYPVSDAELKQAYEARREAYAVAEPTKEIAFIAVDVTPSEADRQESDKLANTVVAELRTGDVTKDTRKNGLDVQRHDMRLSDVKNPALKAFLETAPADSVSILSNTSRGFSIAKLESRTSRVDSLMISTIGIQGGKGLVDSVMLYVQSGQPLDSINKTFPAEAVMYQEAQWTPLYTANGSVGRNLGLQEATYDSLYNSNGSYIVINEMEGVTVLGTVTQKSSPKQVVEYETVDYVLHPSEATLADARTKLQQFITDTTTAKTFVENAAAAGDSPRDLAVTPSTPAVPSGYGFYPDSRAVVRWVIMDGEVGDVSKIYQDKDPANPTFYVAAVTDAYKDYVPYTNAGVKDALTQEVRREKAGNDMVGQYKKGTLAESAQAMQVEVVEIPMLQSSKFDATVSDVKARARMLGSKPSKTVQAFRGDDGVYIFVVNSVSEDQVQMTDQQFADMFLRGHQLNPSAVLRGKKKIENNMFRFEQPE